MLRNILCLSILCSLLFSHFSANAQSESDIVITEIMYNPPESETDSLEFIELYNKGVTTVDLSGYSFSEGVNFTFPSNTTIAAGSYLLLAVNASAFEAFFGVPALQWESGALSNGGEDIVLLDANGVVMDSVDYDDEGDWVTEPDGDGSSLVLCNPESDNSLAVNWSFTSIEAGVNGEGTMIFAHPNRACSPIDENPPVPISVNTTSASTVEIQFNEAVTSASATNSANYTGLGIASVQLDGDGVSVMIELSTPLTLGVFETLTVQNVSDLAGNPMAESVDFDVVFNNTMAELVITEIMYNDPGGEDSLEFVELKYLGTTTAQLGGYTFSEGVGFTFPTMTVEPNEYLVISKIPDFIQEFFGVSSMLSTGGLRNSGEEIEIKNTNGDVIDIVDYGDAEPWPLEADGSGYSLNLCDETTDNSDVLNWSIATDADGAGVYQGVDIYASPGRSGCLIIDNIETLDGTLIDLFPNPTNEYLFVQIEGNKNWELSIFNVVGQEVLKYETIGNRQQLNVSHLEAGIYFVHFQSKTTEEYYVERVVIR